MKIASLKKLYTVWFQAKVFFKLSYTDGKKISGSMGLGKQKSDEFVKFRGYLACHKYGFVIMHLSKLDSLWELYNTKSES